MTKRAAKRKHASARRTPGIGTVLIGSLAQRWQKYLKELRRCKRAFSEESVHDVRVATRRLMSTLMIVEIVLPDQRVRRLQRRLKRLFDAMSPLRDTQVQLMTLEQHVANYPELGTLLTVLKIRERNLMRSLVRRIEKIETASLSRTVIALKLELRRHFSRPMMGEIGRSAVLGAAASRFTSAVWGKERVVPAQPATIHRARIAFKKFRYTLEAVSPLLPMAGNNILKAMGAYQTRMGNIQDAEVLNRMVARFALKRQPASRRKLSGFRRELLARQKELVALYRKLADELYSFRKPMLISQ